MKGGRFHYWINVGLLLAFIIVAVTGLVLEFAFIYGAPGAGRNVDFLGTSKLDWIPWHSLFGIIVILLATVHIFLYFDWLRNMTKTVFVRKSEAEKDTGVVPRAVTKPKS